MLKDFTKEKYDVIIQAGQSNSEGYGYGEVEKPFEPNENIWYLNGDFTISMAKEEVRGNRAYGNFSLSFADEYIKNGRLLPGRKLMIVRSAVDGTGFSDNRWGMEDDLYPRMIEMTKTALDLNSENRLVAFLWHQGETDAGKNMSGDTYYANLKTLIESVRNTFNRPDLPFIAGDFVNQWKMTKLEACEQVIAATKAVCADIGNAGFVETSELLSNNQKCGDPEDIIHFCREALYKLGIKYYKEYAAIIHNS